MKQQLAKTNQNPAKIHFSAERRLDKFSRFFFQRERPKKFFLEIIFGFWSYFQTPQGFLRRLRSVSSQKTQTGPVTGQNKIFKFFKKKLENLSKPRWVKEGQNHFSCKQSKKNKLACFWLVLACVWLVLLFDDAFPEIALHFFTG